MFNGKYISISEVIEEVYGDLRLQEEINISDTIRWSARAIGLLGVPMIYIDKVTGQDPSNPTLQVQGHRAKLPCDLKEIMKCREACSGSPMIMSSYSFQSNISNDTNENRIKSQYTYSINDNYMITSFETGEVEMQYKAYPMDSNGLPIIPDEARVKEAFISYINYKIYERKWLNDETQENKFRYFEQEWLWNSASASTMLRTPSVDEMQKIANMWVSLIPRMEEHYNSFRNTFEPEQRRIW